MIKVFFGKDPGYTSHLAHKEWEKLLKANGNPNFEVYDGFQNPVSELLDSFQSMSIFEEKKFVFVSNAYFFMDSKTRKGSIKESAQDYAGLEDYLLNPSEDTDVFFVVPGDVAKTGSPNKALSSPTVSLVCADIPSDNDMILYAYQRAKEEQCDINREAAALLLERTKGDFLAFENNLNKLFTYTKNVVVQDVIELVYRPLEDNIFSIVSLLVKGEVSKALHVYQDLTMKGYDALSLLPVFASQFSNMAQVKALAEEGLKKDDIAQELSLKPGVVYYALKDSASLSFVTLLSVLKDLGQIEKDIKINQDDGDLKMTLFIAQFSKTYLRRTVR